MARVLFPILRDVQRWKDEITATPEEINAVADQSGQGALVKTMQIAIDATPDGTEQDTGEDLPAKSIVLGVYLDVTTAEVTGGTKTMDVGLLSTESGGDADGFLVGVACDATGIIKGTLLNTGQTLGAFLAVDEDGAGVLVPEGHVTGDAVSVCYTAGSVDWAEFRGTLNIVYIELA